MLPEGLLPRFIVRTHSLSEGEYRWRTGVVLRFEEGRALVKADMVDKKVYIQITGKRKHAAACWPSFARISSASTPI